MHGLMVLEWLGLEQGHGCRLESEQFVLGRLMHSTFVCACVHGRWATRATDCLPPGNNPEA